MTTGSVARASTSGIASVPSTSRSDWIEAQWLMPPTTGGIAICSGLTPACAASHSRLLACAAHEQSPNDFTLGAAMLQ